MKQGRVTVNGRVVDELGAKADPDTDEIAVDGRPVSLTDQRVYLVLNKPTGYVSTVADRHAPHTVMELLREVRERVYPVGRLDADTAGLQVFTNDGDFAQALTHPSHSVPRTYRAVVRGIVSDFALTDLCTGVLLEDGKTRPARAELIEHRPNENVSIVDLEILEGRNRQVRRMLEAVGYPVLALTRTRLGPLRLEGLAPGTWRRLRRNEIDALRTPTSHPSSAPPSDGSA